MALLVSAYLTILFIFLFPAMANTKNVDQTHSVADIDAFKIRTHAYLGDVIETHKKISHLIDLIVRSKSLTKEKEQEVGVLLMILRTSSRGYDNVIVNDPTWAGIQKDLIDANNRICDWVELVMEAAREENPDKMKAAGLVIDDVNKKIPNLLARIAEAM